MSPDGSPGLPALPHSSREWAKEKRAPRVAQRGNNAPIAGALGEENVFFDTPFIDSGGTPDLQVIVERCSPNGTAIYWRYLKSAKRYEAVGAYPVFTLDAKRKTLTAYVKRGAAGHNSAKTIYARRQGKLVSLPR
jgi:hypothetical protein